MRYALRLVALSGSLSVAFLLGPGASDSFAQRAAKRAPRSSRPPAAAPAPVRYYIPAPAPSAPAPAPAPAPARSELTTLSGPATFSYSSGYSTTPARPSPATSPATGYYYTPAPAPAPTQGRPSTSGGSRRPAHVTSDDDPYAYKS